MFGQEILYNEGLKRQSYGTCKPDEPHMSGTPTVRKGDGSAGIGCWKKRMLNCNGSDRGCYFSFTKAHIKKIKKKELLTNFFLLFHYSTKFKAFSKVCVIKAETLLNVSSFGFSR